MNLTHLGLSEEVQASLRDRLIARSTRDSTSGCLVWGGATTWGYGVICTKSQGRAWTFRAHRVAYEAAKGSIPTGLDLDHLCRNRACIEPDHLEPVTRRVNSLRGQAPTIVASNAGVCMQGHAVSGSNIKFDGKGRKHCRECANRRWREGPGEKRKIAKNIVRDLTCQQCGRLFERSSRKGPAPQTCSIRCQKKAYRVLLRDRWLERGGRDAC